MVGRNRREANLGVFLLASQLLGFGVENIPPVTLALIIGQAAIFLDLFPSYFPSANRVCMSSYLVYQHRDWSRMILATFYHANDLHLYYNMVSLLYKGTSLERRFGSPYFAYLVTVFSALTSATYVGLGLLFSEVFDDESYLTSCAVGFSGVLFALKVLKTHYSPPGTQYMFGVVPIPSKYVFWAELVLIQLLVPNASFTGHLAGILVGLAYTHGPLRILMNAFLSPGEPRHSSSESLFLRRGPSSSTGVFQRTPGYRQSTSYPSAPSPGYGPSTSRPSAPSPGYGQATSRPSAPSPGFGPSTSRPSAPSPGFRQSASYPSAPGPGFHQSTSYPSAPYSDEDETTGSAPPYDQSENRRDLSGNRTYPHSQRNYSFAGGLDEEEQYQRAVEESLRNNPQPSTSSQASTRSSSQRLYPDLNDLRSRRTKYYH